MLLLFASEASAVQFDRELSLHGIDYGAIDHLHIHVLHEDTLRIEGMALAHAFENNFYSYGWILDSETREPVWIMGFENASSADRLRTRSNRLDLVRFDEFFVLPPGYYEIYYSARLPDVQRSGSIISQVVTALTEDEYSEERDVIPGEKLGITVHGSSSAVKQVRERDVPFLKTVFFNLTPAVSDGYYEQRFEVIERVVVRLYAIGEFSSFGDSGNDYGWIARGDSIIWDMSPANTVDAGGGLQNRKAMREVILEPGDYSAHFVCDGSHAPSSWVTEPPWDPEFWGLSLLVDSALRESVKRVSGEPAGQHLISYTGLGNNQYRTAGISLEHAAELRICALGESSYSYLEMADYGWLIDADTKEPVWQMTPGNTAWAGGHRKNRLFDGVVSLGAGDYILYYFTDYSHAFQSWNQGPPRYPLQWGITVDPVSAGSAGQEGIRLFDPRHRSSENAIVRLVGVREEASVEKQFTLEEAGDIEIYAIGEGAFGTLTDYGWIERTDSGRIVWEMNFRNSTYAGGGRANRIVRQSVFFNPGEYTVHFITDDSHSYNGWKELPPNDPESYGITLYKTSQQ